MLLMVFLQKWNQSSAKKLCPAIHYPHFSTLLDCRPHKVLGLGCWVKNGPLYNCLVLFPCGRRNFRIIWTQGLVINGIFFLWIVLDHWWLLSRNMQCVTFKKHLWKVHLQWGRRQYYLQNPNFIDKKNRYILRLVANSQSTLTGCDFWFLNMQKMYI